MKPYFTFVTDYVATLPVYFGASISLNRFLYSDRWVWCIAHQLNTAMKRRYDNVTDVSIRNDMENLKKVIRIFKKSEMNYKMTAGKALKQEVSTKFGTTFDKFERLISSANNVVSVIDFTDHNSWESPNEVFELISFKNSSYPSLNAITTFFNLFVMHK